MSDEPWSETSNKGDKAVPTVQGGKIDFDAMAGQICNTSDLSNLCQTPRRLVWLICTLIYFTTRENVSVRRLFQTIEDLFKAYYKVNKITKNTLLKTEEFYRSLQFLSTNCENYDAKLCEGSDQKCEEINFYNTVNSTREDHNRLLYEMTQVSNFGFGNRLLLCTFSFLQDISFYEFKQIIYEHLTIKKSQLLAQYDDPFIVNVAQKVLHGTYKRTLQTYITIWEYFFEIDTFSSDR